MTSQAHPFPMRDAMNASLTGQTLIVAEDRFLSSLHALEPAGVMGAAALHPLPAYAAIPDDLVRNARVMVLEVDAGDDASLRRLAAIRAGHPNVAIIAALRQTDLSLVRALIRQGVIDVTELPFSLPQLQEQLLDAWSTQAELQSPADLGQSISLIGATGGAGATSVLTHLASALSKKNEGSRGVCLVDLDLQKGTVASYLGLEPQVSIQSLLDAGARLDRELMQSAVTDTALGFSVIAAPSVIAPVDRIDVDHLIATIKLIQASFDYVVFDLPPMWTDWSLSLVSWSNQILLLTDTSISGLNQAKRTLNLLSSVEVPANRTGVVVNRVERGVFRSLRTPDIERTLGAPLLATIADAGPPLRAAQDQGLLISATHGKNRFSTDIAALAGMIVDGAGSDR